MTREKKTHAVLEVLSREKVAKAIKDLLGYVTLRYNSGDRKIALVGIQTRGAFLARRLAHELQSGSGIEVPVGILDITLYRDDFGASGVQLSIGDTQLDFDIDDKQLILIDDVLFTGRTVRAALDEIMDFGRPKMISLAVLIDRGHRELPIAADFAAIRLDTKREQSVNLHLTEIDGKDEIVIYEPADPGERK